MRGIALKQRTDPRVGAALTEGPGRFRRDHADRILPRGDIDRLIAATALVHDLIVVTRNIRDFEDTGAVVLNPWDIS